MRLSDVLWLVLRTPPGFLADWIVSFSWAEMVTVKANGVAQNRVGDTAPVSSRNTSRSQFVSTNVIMPLS
jgi:hypothetical protein